MGKILQLKPPTAQTTIFSAVSKWVALKPANTGRQYLSRARSWSDFLGADVESDHARARWAKAKHAEALEYCNQLAAGKAQDERHGLVSSSTVRQHLSILKSIYDELIAQGLVDTNPFVRVIRELKCQDAGERRPHKRLPNEKVRRLLDWKPKNKEETQKLAIISLFFGAALRRSEVINIRLGDLRETEKRTTVVQLLQTKAQKTQSVSLPEWAAQNVNAWKIIRQLEGASAKDYLLVRYDASNTPHRYSDSTIYRWWKSMCKEFDIGEEWSPHCARVTAITQLLDQGKDHRSVQELSRHSSVLMVERYDRRRVEADNSSSKELKY